jgi:DNA-binding PadR family transcriptional regulator
MARSRKGDLSGRMAVLGLVVKQPDTAVGITARLGEEFPSAHWPRSTAHHGLDSLVEEGLVRKLAVGDGSVERFEATPEGEVEFRKWLRASLSGPLVMRDAIQVKLALCEDHDVPRMVEIIREYEQVCAEASEAAQVRLNKAKRSGLFGPADGADVRSRVLSAMMTDEVLWWVDWGKRLQRFRIDIEGRGRGPGMLGGADGR